MEPDLSFVTSQTLWDELKKRFDTAIFVGVTGLTSEEYGTIVWYKGPGVYIPGLCDYAKAGIMRRLYARPRGPEPQEG